MTLYMDNESPLTHVLRGTLSPENLLIFFAKSLIKVLLIKNKKLWGPHARFWIKQE